VTALAFLAFFSIVKSPVTDLQQSHGKTQNKKKSPHGE
jgi:hypothetical protein